MLPRMLNRLMLTAVLAAGSSAFAAEQSLVLPVVGDASMVFNNYSAEGVGPLAAATTALGAEQLLSVQYCDN